MSTQRVEKLFHLIGVAIAVVSIAIGLSKYWFNRASALDVISVFPDAAVTYAWMLDRFGTDGEGIGQS